MYSRENRAEKENRNPPLLFNLAELQNVCSKLFKISPDETLKIVQELYEKKLVTYPRTDARVLSTAAAKEIYKNISGLRNYEHTAEIAQHIIEQEITKIWQRPDMLMISRSQTIMQSYPQARA